MFQHSTYPEVLPQGTGLQLPPDFATVIKILKKLIYNLVFAHVKTSCPLSPPQWGFLPGRSASSALLTVTDEWHQILEQNVEVGAIFFDIKKAFDTVPHRTLLYKLSDMGLHPHIL